MVELTARNLADTEQAARNIVTALPERGVVLFRGEMGAGKTTLIKMLCRLLGVEDEVSSPTFALVNEYLTAENRRIYHFDLYRIEDPEEALDIGIEEYFDDDALSLVEWPERIEEWLPEDAFTIDIKVVDDKRIFCFPA
jgi:tRNA threonylcarbamoyladenosine biosynthesis protein TsaE